MKLMDKHQKAIESLVEHHLDGLTQDELAEKVGVTRKTLFNWMNDPDFTQAFDEAKAKWRKSIDHFPYIHRRMRIDKLHKLLADLPHFYLSGYAESRSAVLDPLTGKLMTDADGNLVKSVAIYRSNAAEIAKLLTHISEEYGGDVMEELDELRKLIDEITGGPQLVISKPERRS